MKTSVARVCWVMLSVLSPLCVYAATPKVLYVDDSARGAGTGLDWANAYRYLQDALAAATEGDEIRVAAGFYLPDCNSAQPDGTGKREATFDLVRRVNILGGYAGVTTDDPNVRNTDRYRTYLRGDLFDDDLYAPDPNRFLNIPERQNNVFHIVTVRSTGAKSVLDGLFIWGGHANGTDTWQQRGGGICCGGSSVQIKNCIFLHNAALYGGAVYVSGYDSSIEGCLFQENGATYGAGVYNSDTDLSCRSCRFKNNAVTLAGGAMFHGDGEPAVVNCAFTSNSAGGYCSIADYEEFVNAWRQPFTLVHSGWRDGGAIYNRDASPTIVNCTFVRNTAGHAGAAVFNRGEYRTMPGAPGRSPISYWWPSYPKIYNSTFTGNAALHGDAVFNNESRPSLTHCLFWSNPHARQWTNRTEDNRRAPESYCMTQEVWPSPGDALWPSPVAPDGHLASGSLAINAGDPNVVLDPNALRDRDDEPRPQAGSGARIDIGADEFLDTDGDRLPDWWENRYFEPPGSANPLADNDEDGLSNLEEYELFLNCPAWTPLHVDGRYASDPQRDGSAEHPFSSIQEALDNAITGDTVLVHRGTYAGPDNTYLHFWNNSICLRSQDGPEVTIIDCNGTSQAVYVKGIFGTRILLEGFQIISSGGDFATALRLESCECVLRNCILRNAMERKMSGLTGMLSNLVIDDVTMTCDPNAPDPARSSVGTLLLTNVTVQDTWRLGPGSLWVAAASLQGPGRIQLDPGTELRLVGYGEERDESGAIISWGDGSCVLRCDVSGPGHIRIPPTDQLIIEGDAVVNLGSSDDSPTADEGGGILVEGSLLVRDHAILENTNVDVKLLAIDTPNDVQYNNITLREASAGFGGEFFVSDAARIRHNNITSEGDRYLDLDPNPKTSESLRPVIEQNRISVTIKEGIRGSRGTLLELRAKDFDRDGNDSLGVSGARQVAASQGYQGKWALEKLVLREGTKLNLTNRQGFEYEDRSDWETVYVKDLIMEPNSVLNTAFQTLYYQRLLDHDGPGAVELVRNLADPLARLANGAKFEDIPLLGFSLGIIAMDDDNEFTIRVRKRLNDPDDPADPNDHYDRPDAVGSIARIPVDPNDPNSNGVMVMDMGSASSIAAKGAFARAGEEDITVKFEYLFREGTGRDAELIVYLSDDPEVSRRLREVARITPPSRGQAGSVGSDRFAVFSGTFSKWDLNFIRGTYVELELRGGGACCWIDNWDPSITCSQAICGNYNGDDGVTWLDYLVMSHELAVPDFDGGTKGCLDMVADGCLTPDDMLVWDTCSRLNACPFRAYGSGSIAPKTAQASGLRALSYASNPTQLRAMKEQAPLVLLCKTPSEDLMTLDSKLYYVTPTGTYADQAAASGNGRLTVSPKGPNGALFQIQDNASIVSLDTNVTVADVNDKSCQGKSVSVGFDGSYASSVPLLDAAFHPTRSDVIYVVPVLVDKGKKRPYKAGAKLLLDGSGGYTVEALYGMHPLDEPNQSVDPNGKMVTGDVVGHPDRQHLKEIEVSPDGRYVYVLSSHNINHSNWVLVYEESTGRRCGLLQVSDPNDTAPDVESASAMLVSAATRTLFLTSSARSSSPNRTPADDLTVHLYRYDIDPSQDGNTVSVRYRDTIDILFPDPGESLVNVPDGVTEPSRYAAMITSITQDPAGGTLYVTGFSAPQLVDDAWKMLEENADLIEGRLHLTVPVLAEVPASATGPIPAKAIKDWPKDGAIPLPLSMVWDKNQSKALGAASALKEGAGAGGESLVSVARKWLSID